MPKSRRRRDGGPENSIHEMHMAQKIPRHFYGPSSMKNGFFYSFNALVAKREKYKAACSKGIVSVSDAYVLAINSRGIPHAPFGNTLPYFVQAFLPVGPIAVAIDRKSLEVADSHYQYRDAIQKQSGASVSTKAFLDTDFSFCSAVLHSSVDCVNRPVEFGGDFCVLHNPNALHPIDESVFSWARQMRFKNGQIIESA
jgi:type I restriction enzyme S subunit